jgi:superoxide dismutase, Cu-Zn family
MTSPSPRAAAGWGAALLLTACSHGGGGGPAPAPMATGTFHNATGDRVGVATLTDSAGTLQLGVSAASLTPGAHGFHVHAGGACEAPGFSSAGPHLNPEHRQHGRLNPDGPHLGDLPNLVAKSDGSVDTSFAVPRALAGPGPGSVRQPGGTALVIHAGPDDERTDPSGDSGARVACAVLQP